MGFGDSLMALAEAREAFLSDPSRRVATGNPATGRVTWEIAYENVPYMARPRDVERGEDVQWVENYPGHRPYIDYAATEALLGRWAAGWGSRAGKIAGRWVWVRGYKPRPADPFLSAREMDMADTARRTMGDTPVLIEPHIKPRAPLNKDWGWRRWQALVEALKRKGVNVWQIGEPGCAELDGCKRLQTVGVRHAMAVMSAAYGYVGPEGGLHHAAAAFRRHAVVIFGGYISPDVTGYAFHDNVAPEHPASPCGRRRECHHCHEVMGTISVEDVTRRVIAMVSGHQIRSSFPDSRAK